MPKPGLSEDLSVKRVRQRLKRLLGIAGLLAHVDVEERFFVRPSAFYALRPRSSG